MQVLRRWDRSCLLAVALVGAGCGPIEYFTFVSHDAVRAVAVARAARAERFAPYEFTAASEYLHKARELAGYSRWQEAVEFGKKAEDLGRRAQVRAQQLAGRPEEEPR